MTISNDDNNTRPVIAPRCLSIDIEVGVKDTRIHSYAAIRGDTGEAFLYKKGDLNTSLVALDQFAGQACLVHGKKVLADLPRHSWALAYALSWLSVAGGNSVMPPWVRRQFPLAGQLVKKLRDTSCGDPACSWTTPAEKFAHVYQLIETELPADSTGGAIVYCATRKATEEISAYLQEKGLKAGHFHASLPPETKKHVQQGFIKGGLRVITATNAFGMGIATNLMSGW